jgi:phosphoribosylamine--glycine ligase/phosphoribosylformylglycinamidine cyclo-ligase
MFTSNPNIPGADRKARLMIAQAIEKHDTVGIDLVAMNVNDLVVQGAQPLMFLDYYGCSKLNSEHATAFVEGVCAGCVDANCALVSHKAPETLCSPSRNLSSPFIYS